MLIKQINACPYIPCPFPLFLLRLKKKKSKMKKKKKANAFAKEVRHWFLKQSPGTVDLSIPSLYCKHKHRYRTESYGKQG